MKMKNLFKLCDFYGTEFHWYFNYKPKYYTCHGGILSILSVLFCIVAFIIFGLEDFERLHPISSISTMPPLVHKTIKFGEQKLYLPWRVMDYGESFINHEGILFPRIYYFTNKYNNETGIMETYYNLLNYTLCNETSMKYIGKDFLIDSPLDKLFCIDMEDLNMGGSWNSDFVNYIRLDLNLCENGISYDESNKNCTKYDYLNSLFGVNNNWFIELLIPTVQFQPNNKTVPFLVLYSSHYYGLSTSSNKVDRIYFQEHIFEDKQGWILDKKKSITYWGVSSIKTDYYNVGQRDIFRYGSTSRIYSFKIYLDYGTVYYTRKYKKLFEIISEMLPIIKVILLVFSFASETINNLKVTKKINEYIIGNEINLSNKRKNKSKNNNCSLNNLKFSYLNQKKNEKNITKNKPVSNKDSSKILCINENINNNKYYKIINNINHVKNKKNKISLKEDLYTKPCNSLEISIKNSNILEIFEKKIPNFPLSYYFFGSLLNKISSKRENNYVCISHKFDISYNFFTHLIDISSYISLYQQFESLKNLVLNELRTKNTEGKNEEISLNGKNDITIFKKILKNNLTFENT